MTGTEADAGDAAWRALVDKVLKGADFDRVLVSRTADDLRIEPLYPKAEDPPVIPFIRQGPWWIVQPVDHPDPAIANEFARADLAGGADGLRVALAGSASARGFGLPIDGIAPALDGLALDQIALRFDPAPHLAEPVLRAVADLGVDPDRLAIDFGIDPIGDAVRTGDSPAPVAAIVTDARSKGFRSGLLRADGRVHHDAGATEAQELAGVLATGLAYWRALDEAGWAEDEARNAISFQLVADADAWLTIAKFRAFRRLWAEIETSCGVEARPIHLAAETSWRMTTRRDPWVNLLRTTVATFGAAVGGADSILVLPHTAALGLGDGFARRMARNSQIILRDESHLARVTDPAAGSGGLEALIEALADKAWSLFQATEQAGGIARMLDAGSWQAELAASRAERQRAVRRMQHPMTGTTEYPDLDEAPVSVLLPASVEPDGARLAEPFEHLRDRADRFRERTGGRPAVFLASIGRPTDHASRAAFVGGMLAAGGTELRTGEASASIDASVAAFRASGLVVACLCGSDETYAAFDVEGLARALKQAGCRFLLFAGRPGEREASLRAAGVDAFLFKGVDVVDRLDTVLEHAGALP